MDDPETSDAPTARRADATAGRADARTGSSAGATRARRADAPARSRTGSRPGTGRPGRRAQSELNELRRLQILEATASVLAERGVAETSIADIAEAAGVSAALVIYYFGTKDTLLAQALTFSDERFYAGALAAMDGLESATERLGTLLLRSCAGLDAAAWRADWSLWLEMWVRALRDPALAPARQALDRRWRATIADVVREGQASGEFAPGDADAVALHLAALIDGLAVQVVLGDAEVSSEQMHTLVVAIASRELGIPPGRLASPAGSERPSRRRRAQPETRPEEGRPTQGEPHAAGGRR